MIITGASISNGTIDDLLSWTRPGARVIVTGPTASILPDALFKRNASIVSGVQVTDPDLALDLLAEGVGAYHLFHTCVRKRQHHKGLRPRSRADRATIEKEEPRMVTYDQALRVILEHCQPPRSRA